MPLIAATVVANVTSSTGGMSSLFRPVFPRTLEALQGLPPKADMEIEESRLWMASRRTRVRWSSALTEKVPVWVLLLDALGCLSLCLSDAVAG